MVRTSLIAKWIQKLVGGVYTCTWCCWAHLCFWVCRFFVPECTRVRKRRCRHRASRADLKAGPGRASGSLTSRSSALLPGAAEVPRHPGVSAMAGEAVKLNKYKAGVQSGGPLGPLALSSAPNQRGHRGRSQWPVES